MINPSIKSKKKWHQRADNRHQIRAYLLLSPSLLLLALLAASIVLLLIYSFYTYRSGGGMLPQFTLENYHRFFQSHLYWRVVLNTVRFSIVTTVLALVLGYPLALYLSKLKGMYQAVGFLLLTVPLWTSVIVRTYGWVIILSRQGLINSFLEWIGFRSVLLDIYPGFWPVIIALLEITLPLMVLPIYSSLINLDPSIEEASTVLGASRIRTFFKVTLPITMPGVFAGVILTFMLVLSAYITPVILGGRKDLVLPVLIESQITGAYNVPFAAALALIMLVLMMIVIFGFRRFLRLDQLMGG